MISGFEHVFSRMLFVDVEVKRVCEWFGMEFCGYVGTLGTLGVVGLGERGAKGMRALRSARFASDRLTDEFMANLGVSMAHIGW